MATQCSLSSLELRVQFCLLVCCTYPSSSTVNKEKNLIDQRASLRVDTRETQHTTSRLSAVAFGSGSAPDPSPPRRRRASCSSGRPDFRETVVQKSQDPNPEVGRPDRSTHLNFRQWPESGVKRRRLKS